MVTTIFINKVATGKTENDTALEKCTGDESLCDYAGGVSPEGTGIALCRCPQRRSVAGQEIRTLGPE